MQLKLFTPNNHVQNLRSQEKKVNQRLSTARNQPSWDLWTPQSETDRDMALLFLDIRNFTPLVGSIQASDVVYLVKKLLTAFQRIVRIHHGRIIETTGDGFYAAFGFNQSIDEAVTEAVASADTILKHLETMNTSSREASPGHKIEAGIGIHAGKVATGRITIGGTDHLMVMGHAVNIASRIENATKELNNNFIISTSAYNLLNGNRDSISASINLKGVEVPFDVELIGNYYNRITNY